MKFLTKSECEQWCAERGLLTPAPLYKRPAPDGYVTQDFSIPEDAGARVALCRSLWPGEWTQGQRLLWVKEWSIWPSGEHMPIYTKWRSALGDNRVMIEAPGHVVEPDEDDDGLSVLVMSALFLWDCWVYTENAAVVMISHDEFGTVFQRRDVQQSWDWKEILRIFGVLRQP